MNSLVFARPVDCYEGFVLQARCPEQRGELESGVQEFRLKGGLVLRLYLRRTTFKLCFVLHRIPTSKKLPFEVLE